ncbi:hypothetical protein PTKIN_Ptkin13bG0201900 [Pterospermum kingtungense]
MDLLCDWFQVRGDTAGCNLRPARKIGFGMILRDDGGSLIACRTKWINGLCRSKEGEAMGIVEALSWIRSINLQNVITEIDTRLLLMPWELQLLIFLSLVV